ncbi:MAG: hypothetical protein HYY41_02345 [Chloroflexi bacterium]|nr:hypothetical protein [Chloroflexota bacterium]
MVIKVKRGANLAVFWLLTAVLVLSSCAQNAPAVPPQTENKTTESSPSSAPPKPEPRPANFIVSGLTVLPKETTPGSLVTAEALVTNTGELAGTYDAILKLDDVLRGRETVSLSGGSSQKVTFRIAPVSAGTHSVSIDGQSTTLIVASPTTPPSIPSSPAKFQVTSIDVAPIVVLLGEKIAVTANVGNIGGTKGSYSLTLKVNGAIQETRDLTIGPGSTQTTVFNVVKDVPGLYTVEIEGFTEIMRVKETGSFPRLANCYIGVTFFGKLQQLDSSQIKSSVESLARWDLIIVDYNRASFARQHLERIRKLNPHIKILAYIEAGTGGNWRWLLTNDLQAQNLPSYMTSERINFMRYLMRYYGISPSDSNENLFLHHGQAPGSQTTPSRVVLMDDPEQWQGMNPNSDWPNYLANFVKDKVMSSGLFDGVFYDNVWEGSKKFASNQNIDMNNDGVAESPSVVQQLWQQGMTKLLKITRDLLGPEAIIFGNPGSEWFANSSYFDYANGHMQENALGTSAYSSHDFTKVWDIYERNMQSPAPPSRIHIIATDTDNRPNDREKPQLSITDLQKMRYGLTITLLDDGYYQFGMGDRSYGTLWWFPEYDINLGLAKGKAQKQSDGTWTREFQNGIVAVNPTYSASTISFATTYQNVSTGNKGTSFTIQPQDGGIFLLVH